MPRFFGKKTVDRIQKTDAFFSFRLPPSASVFCLLSSVFCLLWLLAAGCAGTGAPPTGGVDRPAAGATGPTAARDFREIVQKAKDKVFPAVVFIKSLRESHEGGRKETVELAGSGVLISPVGEILTNWHVVDKTVELRCLLFDGQAYPAKTIATDKDTDLALIQLQLPAGAPPLPCAVLGDSTVLKEGDFVMAMGAPWGLSRSVSIGIIACTRRFLPESSEYSLWLQTDASICPGNSGGPLVNTAGEIVGLNTLAMRSGGDLGFAVPASTISFTVDQFRKNGAVKWSWTGLLLQPLRDFDKNIYFEAAEGVVVAGTEPESPARRAGIQPRDRILRLNGQALNAITPEDLPGVRRAFGTLPLDQPARIELVRGEEALTIELTPREKGKVEGEELDCPRWDLTVKAINQFDNPNLYFYRKEGVFVFGTRYPGNASSAGLSPQDILLSIDGKEVKTLADVKAIHKEALAKVEQKHRLVFTILRNGLEKQIVLNFLRDYEKE